MEWSENQELQAIFREEVAERARTLVEGGNALGIRDLDEHALNDLSRDGHTIKGNALVMGFPTIADAGKVLEATWKELRDDLRAPSAELGGLLARLASVLPAAVDIEGRAEPRELLAALAAVRAFLSEGDDDPPAGGPGPAAEASPKSGPVPRGPAEPPAPPRPSSSLQHPTQVQHRPSRTDVPPGKAAVDLGGLLSAIEGRVIGDATRVDSAKLFELINRFVEVKLDIEALAQGLRGLRTAVTAGPGEVAALAYTWEGSVNRLEQSLDELQSQALDLATVPLREVTDTFPQLANYLGRRTGKELRFELIGDEVEVDRQIVDALREPLRHLLVNAIDHGIEMPLERIDAGKPSTATVTIRASVKDHRLVVTVEDDGRGVDWDRVREVAEGQAEVEASLTGDDLGRVLFGAGFSTIAERTDLSGDGIGLAAASDMAADMNGGLHLDTTPGAGTTVTLTLPASLAMQDVLLVGSDGHRWGIPEVAVLATFPIVAAEIRPGEHRMELWYEGHALPLSSFASAVGLPETEEPNDIVVLSTRLGSVALTIPQVDGRRQVAVKGLGPVLAGSPHLAGAALLGGGEVVVVVDPDQLGDRVRSVPEPVVHRPKVLVVDDSQGVRQLVGAALSGQGFDVVVASGAGEALQELKRNKVDAMVVDYQMPGPDGVELVEQIRNRSRSIPIVMVSAVATSEDQDRAWKAGVDAYLDKFDLRKGALVDTLRNLLQMRGVTFEERSA
ncbi:MAG: response regulator [Acidimicrobiia bacterium]|nr:response regulator [Acidimicrobiia bacterium]